MLSHEAKPLHTTSRDHLDKNRRERLRENYPPYWLYRTMPCTGIKIYNDDFPIQSAPNNSQMILTYLRSHLRPSRFFEKKTLISPALNLPSDSEENYICQTR